METPLSFEMLESKQKQITHEINSVNIKCLKRRSATQIYLKEDIEHVLNE
jgi:hypothetical protein